MQPEGSLYQILWCPCINSQASETILLLAYSSNHHHSAIMTKMLTIYIEYVHFWAQRIVMYPTPEWFFQRLVLRVTNEWTINQSINYPCIKEANESCHESESYYSIMISEYGTYSFRTVLSHKVFFHWLFLSSITCTRVHLRTRTIIHESTIHGVFIRARALLVKLTSHFCR